VKDAEALLCIAIVASANTSKTPKHLNSDPGYENTKVRIYRAVRSWSRC